jgi:hypothetical protein
MVKFYAKLTTLSLLLLIPALQVSAWSWLNVQDPRNWSKYGQGSVDEATLTIEPKGIYMECNLYLSLSAKGNDFSDADTMEATYYFSLPEKSIVHDAYLWVEDSMVQSRLIDRWSAWQIYESIVKRRWDPSVLYKDWDNYYHLQVYPILGQAFRKVRITYLVPTRWTSRTVSCALPFDMLNASKIPLEKLIVLVKENGEFKNPHTPTLTGVGFVHAEDPQFGECLKATIPGTVLGYNQSLLSFDTPLINGVYLGNLDEGGKGLYQMTVLPSEFFKLKQSKKLLFLVDFEKDNSYYTSGNQVFTELKSLLTSYLNEGDYFNIILSGSKVRMLSSDWIKGDPANIEQVLEGWGLNPVEDYSDLQSLLLRGIKYIKNKGGEGSMVLLSNSDNYGSNDTANILMDEIKDLAPLPVTQVVDFNESYHWYYFGNKYFRGNEYLYTLLTRYTKGNYFQFNYWNTSVSDILEPIFQLAGGTIESYDIHTRLEDGFCFGRYDLAKSEQVIYLDKPILQIGSYNGSFPFVIEMAGLYKEQPLSISKKISWENAFASDSLLRKMWAGNYISTMEQNWSWDNASISEIIDKSIANRVLSNYTAFISLEPGMDSLFNDPGNTAGNPGVRIEVSDGIGSDGMIGNTNTQMGAQILGMIQDSIRARVYPNPFHNHTRIELSLGNFQILSKVKMSTSVIDIAGRTVAEFNPEELFFNGQMTIEWNGTDSYGKELPKGIYYFCVKTSTFAKVVRLIKL